MPNGKVVRQHVFSLLVLQSLVEYVVLMSVKLLFFYFVFFWLDNGFYVGPFFCFLYVLIYVENYYAFMDCYRMTKTKN